METNHHLTPDDLKQITAKIKILQERALSILDFLKTTSPREVLKGDDVAQNTVFDNNLFATSESYLRAESTLKSCRITLEKIEKTPSMYGFDTQGKPIPKQILLCNPFCVEIPSGYKQKQLSGNKKKSLSPFRFAGKNSFLRTSKTLKKTKTTMATRWLASKKIISLKLKFL